MTGNPFAFLTAAASGSLEAQRALAAMALSKAIAEPQADPEAVIREGLVFARLAAAHGEAADEARVISMLAIHAELLPEHERGAPLGEAMARYSRLADRGEEVPGISLEHVVEATQPSIVAAAICFQELLKEGERVA